MGLICGSNRTKQCTYAKLICLKWNCFCILNWIVWNRTVSMYKTGFGVNNLQWLICHKAKPNFLNMTDKGRCFHFFIQLFLFLWKITTTRCFTIVKTKQWPRIFLDDIILFLFSDYCRKIINILIYSTKSYIRRWSRRPFVWSHITKFSLSRLFNQDTERISISVHFQTEVRFSCLSRTLKFMALVKIKG